VIDAGQSGNADYLAATTVKQTILVTASGGPTVASVQALTLADAQGSPAYQGLSTRQKAAITATVNAVTSVLNPVGQNLSPAQNAVRIDVYDAGLVALRLTGFLTSAQVTTLEHQAAQL
jgi:hypothetical protein